MDSSDATKYFGAGGLSWTTYSYKTNDDLSGDFLNIFLLKPHLAGVDDESGIAIFIQRNRSLGLVDHPAPFLPQACTD